MSVFLVSHLADEFNDLLVVGNLAFYRINFGNLALVRAPVFICLVILVMLEPFPLLLLQRCEVILCASLVFFKTVQIVVIGPVVARLEMMLFVTLLLCRCTRLAWLTGHSPRHIGKSSRESQNHRLRARSCNQLGLSRAPKVVFISLSRTWLVRSGLFHCDNVAGCR